MDWRLISAVTLAGASFSMVAFGAYTLRAADSATPDAKRAAPVLSAPSLMPFDASGAATIQQEPERGVRVLFPVESIAAQQTPAATTEYLEPQIAAGVQQVIAAAEAPLPVLVADLPAVSKEQGKAARVYWSHRRHGSWKVSRHVRFCSALHPCTVEKKPQVAVRQVPAEQPQQLQPQQSRIIPRIALMLGVGF